MNLRTYEAVYGNVRIRPLNHDDIEQLRVWRNDKEKTKYLRNIGTITSEMQEAWFTEYTNRDTDVVFAIEEISELNRLVGSLSLYNFTNDIAEIGKIQIGDEEAHGKGIGRISFVLAMLIGFQKFGLKEIIASVNPENIPAYKNYIRIGFEIVGQHNFMDGIEYELFINFNKLRKKFLYVSEIKVMKYDLVKK